MTKNVDLNKYKEFVDGVTSDTSKYVDTFSERVNKLTYDGVNVPRLLTASIGLSGETGEFSELVKKIVFHGKEYNAENIAHMRRELGDISWYWMQACLALNFDPNEVISENVEKLQSRYPGGTFDTWHSENRKEGDI